MNKLIVLVATLAVGALAKADGDNAYQYLYWQVDMNKVESGVGSYDAAMFYTLSGDNKVELSRAERPEVVESARWSSDRVATDLAGHDSASFVFELAQYGDGGWETVGTSATFTYAQLASYLTEWQANASSLPTQGVFSPTFTVPEPTSGLLMLLGLAALALRRRRA